MDKVRLGRGGVVALAVALGAMAWAGEPAPQGLGEQYLRLAGKRRQQIARLQEYIQREIYPQNLDFPGESMPYFVDEKGAPCAVAFLMNRDGKGSLVAQVARENNQIRVMQITPGPALDWILHSGLTQEECAMIQPNYGWTQEDRDRWEREHPGEFPMGGPPPGKETGPAARGDAEKVERERVRAHLEKAAQRLREETHVSLPIALQRLMPEIRQQIKVQGLGFFVEPPAAKGSCALRNGSPAEVRARWVLMDKKGEAKQEGHWLRLKAGESQSVPSDEDRWLFVEWQSDAMQSGNPVAIQ